MDLAPRQRAAIDALLLEREEQFMRVHECETAIEEILGGPYPFPSPPPLPSRQKRKARKAKKAAGKTANAPPAPALPSLREGEVAYRLVYAQDELESAEEHLTAEPLERWLARPLETIRAVRVETIDHAGKPVRTLYRWTAPRA